jgi:predicted neuraminidase
MIAAAWILALAQEAGIVKTENLYEKASFPECHASTIVAIKDGLVAAWFGGTREGHKDVGIWVARHDGKAWTAPVEVAKDDAHPCWNPVLFQPREGPLLLFYKVGPSPSSWWGLLRTSEDGGKSWSEEKKLPEGILGPIKNKPVQLADGTILSPSSTENDSKWRVHFERSSDGGKTWERTDPINDGKTFGAIQPAILTLPEGRLLSLSRSRQQKIVESVSADGGKTWSGMAATMLPNPNSGLDAVTLADGRHLLVYNHTPKGRSPLNVAVSADGKAWKAALVLESEPGEYSYPAVVQSADGLVHITYTWQRRRVKHVVVDPAKLALTDLK